MEGKTESSGIGGDEENETAEAKQQMNLITPIPESEHPEVVMAIADPVISDEQQVMPQASLISTAADATGIMMETPPPLYVQV
jgi:hypothetical protein